MEEFFRQVGRPCPPGTGGGPWGPPLGDTSALPCLARGTRKLSWGCPSRPSVTVPPRWWPSPKSVSWWWVPVPHSAPSVGREGVPRDAACLPLTAGFIDFIVEPTFSVLTDVAEKMVLPLAEDRTKAKGNPAASQQARSAAPPFLSFPSVCVCWGDTHLFWDPGGGGGGSALLPAVPVPAARSGGSRPWMSTWSWGTSKPTWPASAPPGPSTSRRTSRSGRNGRPAVGDGHPGHRGGDGDHPGDARGRVRAEHPWVGRWSKHGVGGPWTGGVGGPWRGMSRGRCLSPRGWQSDPPSPPSRRRHHQPGIHR